MNVLILAAGLGHRLRPHTEHIPKPALPFLNVPMGLFSVDLLQGLPISRIVVNTHHLPEKIESAFSSLKINFPQINFSYENPILGGGGALKKNFALFDPTQPIISLNSDSFLLCDEKNIGAKILETHKQKQARATLLLIKHPEAGKTMSAAWCDENQKIFGFGKKPPNSEKNLTPYHFVGMQVTEPDLISFLPDGFSNILTEVYLPLIHQGKTIQGHVVPNALWFETGNLTSYLDASHQTLKHLIVANKFTLFENILMKKYPQLQTKNNHIMTEKNTPLLKTNAPILYGQNISIHPETKIEGFAIIGDNTIIEENCVIKNSVINSNVRIRKGSFLNNTLVT